MILLVLYQGDRRTDVGLFKDEENVKKLVEKLPGYREETFEFEGDTWVNRYLEKSELPDYATISYESYEYPITRFMFPSDENIIIDFHPMHDFDDGGSGLVDGASLVDAYVVENDELKEYIQKRESMFQWVREYGVKNGFTVLRSFQGSEDGEAILYQKQGDSEWHFLTHMDPCFVALCDESDTEKEKQVKKWI